LKEIRRVLDLAHPVTYSHGAFKKPVTITRLVLNMPSSMKKLRRLGRPVATIDYYIQLLTLMAGLPVKVIEEIDASDLKPGIVAVYEILRSHHAYSGISLPPMTGSADQ